jgi:hypothetical protein
MSPPDNNSSLSNDGPPRRELRIASFAVPLFGNKGSASILVGLIDEFKSEGYAVEALAYRC